MIDRSFWRDRRVFLTGHTGFKGSWLAQWLLNMGAIVTGYSLDPPTRPSLFETLGLADRMRSRIGDIRNRDRLRDEISSFEPEVVFHLAAQPLVRESYQFPVETYETNVMGTVNLLDSLRQCHSLRAAVIVTTDKCYENREWIWGYREDEAMGGHDPYSSSKGCVELAVNSFRLSFFNVAPLGSSTGAAIGTARAGNVIGGGDWAKDRLIPDILTALHARKPVLIRNPYSVRPWQHVLEPLSGYLLLAQRLFEDGQPFAQAWNFGPNDSDARTVEWIVEEMCRLWGDSAGFTIDADPQPHEATYLKLDCSKARQQLGWCPIWDLGTALQRVVEWTRAFQESADMIALMNRQIAEFEQVAISMTAS